MPFTRDVLKLQVDLCPVLCFSLFTSPFFPTSASSSIHIFYAVLNKQGTFHAVADPEGDIRADLDLSCNFSRTIFLIIVTKFLRCFAFDNDLDF
jgi:hypothetical protein